MVGGNDVQSAAEVMKLVSMEPCAVEDDELWLVSYLGIAFVSESNAPEVLNRGASSTLELDGEEVVTINCVGCCGSSVGFQGRH